MDKLPIFPVTVKGGSVYVELPRGATPDSLRKGVKPHLCSAKASDSRHFVVLGAGPAGLAAVEALRDNGYTGRLTMLNREAGAPYDRTMLSKNMGVEEGKAQLRSKQWLEDQAGVTLLTGVRVTAVETGPRRVHYTSSSGQACTLEYTALLCATGGPARTFRADAAEPGPPPIPGAELAGIFPLRTLQHAQGLLAAASAAIEANAPIVVQGGSFIGMETAAYLKSSPNDARDITVVDMFAVPFERTLGARLGQFMKGWHESKGVKFKMSSVVKSFTGGAAGQVTGVSVAPFVPGPPNPAAPPPEATVLPAAVVVVGGGIVPAIDYLQGAEGVALVKGPPGGVEVDEFQRTGNPFVYAAGDIAHIPLRHAAQPGQKWRIEHYNVAMDQGRTAALNMLAHHPAPGSHSAPAPKPYLAVPFFWTQMYGKYLRCAGFCKQPDAVVVQGRMLSEGNIGSSCFLAFYIVKGKVEALMSFNEASPQAAAAQELIRLDRMPAVKDIVEGEAMINLADVLHAVRERVGGGEDMQGGGGAASSSSSSSSRGGRERQGSSM